MFGKPNEKIIQDREEVCDSNNVNDKVATSTTMTTTGATMKRMRMRMRRKRRNGFN